MGQKMRLDKYLANMGIGTRSEVKQMLKKGKIKVNDAVVHTPEVKIDIETDTIMADNQMVSYEKYVYYMLHKPAGVVSATEDNKEKTVIDLMEKEQKKDLFPVGRLDKDTEGLLLITNDGELAHNLLSPKKHVSKVYYAKIDGKVIEEDVKVFKEGVQIDKDFRALPAELEIICAGAQSEIRVTIYEGKFHQVKRMFEAVGKKVTYLKRLSMGSLVLDETLELGQYRRLTQEELEGLQKGSGNDVEK